MKAAREAKAVKEEEATKQEAEATTEAKKRSSDTKTPEKKLKKAKASTTSKTPNKQQSAAVAKPTKSKKQVEVAEPPHAALPIFQPVPAAPIPDSFYPNPFNLPMLPSPTDFQNQLAMLQALVQAQQSQIGIGSTASLGAALSSPMLALSQRQEPNSSNSKSSRSKQKRTESSKN